jgi:smad nuclear-interacting protein 1
MNNAVSDDQALEALLSSAKQNQDEKAAREQNSNNHRNKNARRRDDDGGNSGGGGGGKYGTNDETREADNKHVGSGYHSKRQRKWNRKDEGKNDTNFAWGKGNEDNTGHYGPLSSNNNDTNNYNNNDETERKEEESNVEKQKANFGLSGALAEDENTGNTFNGIVLKFTEPLEARTPNTRWRLYVFKKKKGSNTDKDNDLLQTLHISKQSAYLFGRDRKVADIAVDHPSLSKQHCVIQFRALPDKNDREGKVRCKPYVMDLGSTNGTFINGARIEDARYYELRKGDVITLGASSREYVLLTENTISSDL